MRPQFFSVRRLHQPRRHIFLFLFLLNCPHAPRPAHRLSTRMDQASPHGDLVLLCRLHPGAAACGFSRCFRAAALLTAVVLTECVVLALNHFRCPSTGLAARYTSDRAPNFDIFLPLRLARHNQSVFGTLFFAGALSVLNRYLSTRPPPRLPDLSLARLCPPHFRLRRLHFLDLLNLLLFSTLVHSFPQNFSLTPLANFFFQVYSHPRLSQEASKTSQHNQKGAQEPQGFSALNFFVGSVPLSLVQSDFLIFRHPELCARDPSSLGFLSSFFVALALHQWLRFSSS